MHLGVYWWAIGMILYLRLHPLLMLGADWVRSPALGSYASSTLPECSWFQDFPGALVRSPWDDCGNRGVARSRALMTHWLCIAGQVGGHLGFSCLGLHILLVEVPVKSQIDTAVGTRRLSTHPPGKCGASSWGFLFGVPRPRIYCAHHEWGWAR